MERWEKQWIKRKPPIRMMGGGRVEVNKLRPIKVITLSMSVLALVLSILNLCDVI